jgi:hypothetical protein
MSVFYVGICILEKSGHLYSKKEYDIEYFLFICINSPFGLLMQTFRAVDADISHTQWDEGCGENENNPEHFPRCSGLLETIEETFALNIDIQSE